MIFTKDCNNCPDRFNCLTGNISIANVIFEDFEYEKVLILDLLNGIIKLSYIRGGTLFVRFPVSKASYRRKDPTRYKLTYEKIRPCMYVFYITDDLGVVKEIYLRDSKENKLFIRRNKWYAALSKWIP